MNNQRSPYLFCEPFAGSAALTYWLLGGKPPISYMGGKSGYSSVIANILGLSQHHKPAGVILGEPGPFAGVHATLGGASGSAEDVAGWAVSSWWSIGQIAGAGGFNTTLAYPSIWGDGIRQPETASKIAQRFHTLPRAAEVANIIRSWKDEEPRALWERLKARGWPSLLLPEGCRGRWLGPQSVEEVAGFLVNTGWSYRGISDGPFDPSRAIPNADLGRGALTVEGVSDRCGDISFPSLAVWQGFAEDLPLPADLSGVICYCDPPYENTTGYKHGTCPRETVLRLARDWSGRGATVAISEAVRLDRELGEGWTSVDISHARKGQARTFTKNQGTNRKEPQEWVTLNREPVHVPAKQVSLFG